MAGWVDPKVHQKTCPPVALTMIVMLLVAMMVQGWGCCWEQEKLALKETKSDLYCHRTEQHLFEMKWCSANKKCSW